MANSLENPQVDPDKCTLALGIFLQPKLDMTALAIIQTVDTSGHKMTTGGAKIKAIQNRILDGPATLQVQDKMDGTYHFRFQYPLYAPVDLDVFINSGSIGPDNAARAVTEPFGGFEDD